MKMEYSVICGRTLLRMCCFLLIFGVVPGSAQTGNGDALVTDSWKQGSGRIKEQLLSLVLDANTEEYEVVIPGESVSRSFMLRAKKTFVRTIEKPSMQCWSVSLRERFEHNSKNGHILGGNLLSIEGPGEGDNLPTFANFFCPVEKPRKIFDGGHFPVRQSRRFLVEEFVVDLAVKDYSYDQTTNRLGRTEFLIQIKNK